MTTHHHTLLRPVRQKADELNIQLTESDLDTCTRAFVRGRINPLKYFFQSNGCLGQTLQPSVRPTGYYFIEWCAFMVLTP